MSEFADTIYRAKYAHPGENWPDTVRRVVDNVMRPYLPELADECFELIRARKFLPAGRYLYAAGIRVHQINNCILTRPEDSREGWAQQARRVVMSLGTGGGIGTVYSDLRPSGAEVKGMGGTSTGPLSLIKMSNEIGRNIVGGGSRRAAMWAGLHWSHADIDDFIHLKDWTPLQRQMAAEGMGAPVDQTNISVILDNAFFAAYHTPSHPRHSDAHRIYTDVVGQMLLTGEPGFSVDIGESEGENLRNPCCEITSHDTDDVCNLGSINLPRIASPQEMAHVVSIATAFLLCGTLYSTLCYPELEPARTRNRRLGLGLMGLHEWLVLRGKRYQPDTELATWLDAYATSSECANRWADQLSISRPVKTRAIAPNGTISILGETTSAIEPLYALAYKRRYKSRRDGRDADCYQYVVDATAKRLIDAGVNPDNIETAAQLAADPERRIRFQAWIQTWVDHAISSTINLPAFADQAFTVEDFGDTLMTYLPLLRGITTFPDGSRGRQPLTAVDYADAVGREGTEYREVSAEQSGASGVCGI